jgi:hypothetical protein
MSALFMLVAVGTVITLRARRRTDPNPVAGAVPEESPS